MQRRRHPRTRTIYASSRTGTAPQVHKSATGLSIARIRHDRASFPVKVSVSGPTDAPAIRACTALETLGVGDRHSSSHISGVVFPESRPSIWSICLSISVTGIVEKILFSLARFISGQLLPQARNLLTQLLVPAVNVSGCSLSYGTVLHDHLGVEVLPLPAKLDGLLVTTDGSELLSLVSLGARGSRFLFIWVVGE